MYRNKKIIAVCFYKDVGGKEPVRAWLQEMSMLDRRIIGCDIKTVEFGWPIGMPVCKAIGRGLYEVRSNLSDKRIARVIFCIENGMMILLHGFIKKTQKTPNKEMGLAIDRKKRFLNE